MARSEQEVKLVFAGFPVGPFEVAQHAPDDWMLKAHVNFDGCTIRVYGTIGDDWTHQVCFLNRVELGSECPAGVAWEDVPCIQVDGPRFEQLLKAICDWEFDLEPSGADADHEIGGEG